MRVMSHLSRVRGLIEGTEFARAVRFPQFEPARTVAVPELAAEDREDWLAGFAGGLVKVAADA